MKRILKIFQILLIIFILLINILNFGNVYATNEIASGTCGNDITWSLDSDSTLTITGSGKMSGSTSAWIDYKDQVKNVIFNGDITSISDRAFEKHTNLETISLPDTVTTIGLRAFAEFIFVCVPLGASYVKLRMYHLPPTSPKQSSEETSTESNAGIHLDLNVFSLI